MYTEITHFTGYVLDPERGFMHSIKAGHFFRERKFDVSVSL